MFIIWPTVGDEAPGGSNSVSNYTRQRSREYDLRLQGDWL